MRISRTIRIPEDELQESFVRASGPGGQNVNKVNTAVQLRFNVARNTSLPREVKERLQRLVGRRLTEDGDLLIVARRHRTRERNRQDARQRLMELIERAMERPKARKRTKPTRASREKRLRDKEQRSRVKQNRGRVRRGDD